MKQSTYDKKIKAIRDAANNPVKKMHTNKIKKIVGSGPNKKKNMSLGKNIGQMISKATPGKLKTALKAPGKLLKEKWEVNQAFKNKFDTKEKYDAYLRQSEMQGEIKRRQTK